MVISYHPYTTTKETSFTMEYAANAMLYVEIDTPTWSHSQFNMEENEAMLRYVADLIDE